MESSFRRSMTLNSTCSNSCNAVALMYNHRQLRNMTTTGCHLYKAEFQHHCTHPVLYYGNATTQLWLMHSTVSCMHTKRYRYSNNVAYTVPLSYKHTMRTFVWCLKCKPKGGCEKGCYQRQKENKKVFD